jgi:hypothetical protein
MRPALKGRSESRALLAAVAVIVLLHPLLIDGSAFYEQAVPLLSIVAASVIGIWSGVRLLFIDLKAGSASRQLLRLALVLPVTLLLLAGVIAYIVAIAGIYVRYYG